MNGVRTILACLASVALGAQITEASSQTRDPPKLVRPEDCVIDTIRSGANPDTSAMIRFNCIRKYVRDAVSHYATPLDLMHFKDATAYWEPTKMAFPNPIQERLRITIKNNTKFPIVAATIFVKRKKDDAQEDYFGYAEYPIDPLTVGHVHVPIQTGSLDFWKEYSWGFVSVLGSTYPAH